MDSPSCYPTIPPRVEYCVTEAGEALRGVVDGVCGWTQRYLSHIEASRREFGDPPR